MNEQPNLPPHRPPQMAGITGTLPASCVWLPANAVSQMLAGNYLISPRVTSGEPITSTAILNEKEPRRQASGLWLNINTPGKEWGGAFRALISRRYRSIVRGSSAAESSATRRGLPHHHASSSISGRASRAHSAASATRRRRLTRLATGRRCPESHRAPEAASSCSQPVTASPEIMAARPVRRDRSRRAIGRG